MPDVWLVDVNASTVEVHWRPAAGGYRDRRLVDRAGTIAPLAFPRVALAVRDMIG